jgi:hypothetical protein
MRIRVSQSPQMSPARPTTTPCSNRVTGVPERVTQHVAAGQDAEGVRMANSEPSSQFIPSSLQVSHPPTVPDMSRSPNSVTTSGLSAIIWRITTNGNRSRSHEVRRVPPRLAQLSSQYGS